MKIKIKALKAAFPYTIPIFTGFVFVGIAYGILMNSKGYGVGWSVLMSLIVYAGSSQYLGVTFLTSVFNPIYAFLMTLMLNARYLFYGISMFEKLQDVGKMKYYLIYGLCDETFSIVCSTDLPEGVNHKWFMFFITVLNHFYWVFGTAIGGILGSVIPFNTKGLDFVLTALFVVIFVEQWKSQKDHKPAIIGVLSSIICIMILGRNNFIIPAMVVILSVLSMLRKKCDNENLEVSQ